MPCLTVIMPAHNAASTIVNAVRSTLFDLPQDAEVHVIDDASTDDTGSILERLARTDNRLRVRTASSNRGVAGTLNDLLATVTSEYVARMDADDIVIPGRFGGAMAALSRGSVDVVFSGVVHLGPGKRVRPAAQLPISSSAMPFFQLLVNPVTHSTMVGRVSVLRGADGYRPVPSEDYDLWLRLAARGHRLRRLVRPGVMYRHHPGQVTGGAAWIAAAAGNPSTALAHSALSQVFLGADYGVFEVLRRPALDVSETDRLASFLANLRDKSQHLAALERMDLSRLCRKMVARRLSSEAHRVG